MKNFKDIKLKIIKMMKKGNSDNEIFSELNKDKKRFNSMGEIRRIKHTILMDEKNKKDERR